MHCPLPVFLFLGNVDQEYICTVQDVDKISSALTGKCKKEQLGKVLIAGNDYLSFHLSCRLMWAGTVEPSLPKLYARLVKGQC